jgi:hypothetical protein
MSTLSGKTLRGSIVSFGLAFLWAPKCRFRALFLPMVLSMLAMERKWANRSAMLLIRMRWWKKSVASIHFATFWSGRYGYISISIYTFLSGDSYLSIYLSIYIYLYIYTSVTPRVWASLVIWDYRFLSQNVLLVSIQMVSDKGRVFKRILMIHVLYWKQYLQMIYV